MTKSLSTLTFALTLALAVPVSVGAQDNDAFSRGVAAYESGDYAAAADFWAPLAEDGVPEAQRNLAQLYRLGLGVERDNERAYDLYIAAAEQNSVEAQVNVAFLLLTGEGAEKDPEQAALWFARAADQGDALAQFNLGLMYEKGVGVPRNRETARELYQLAANQGQERALARLDAIEGDLPPDGGEAARRERAEARRAATERAEAEEERAQAEEERAAAAAAEEEDEPTEKAEAEAKTGPILVIERISPDALEEPQAAETDTESTEAETPAIPPATPPAEAQAVTKDAPMSAPPARPKPELFASNTARIFTPATSQVAPRAPAMSQMEQAEAAHRRGDFATALRVAMPLARQGVPAAQFLLGRMFNRGQGVEVDHFQAYSLWRGAADGGDKRAATALANFSARYRPSDLARAEEFYQEQRRLGVLRVR